MAKMAKLQTDNLQTKYSNLDRFFIKKEKFDEQFNKHEVMLIDMNDKVKELLDDYDSETD